jgi:hypothetical protein
MTKKHHQFPKSVFEKNQNLVENMIDVFIGTFLTFVYYFK